MYTDNFTRKIMLAGENLTAFAMGFPLDAGTYYERTLVEGVINGQYVGVISGNLRRSFKTKPAGLGRAILEHDERIASDENGRPYGKKVLDWSVKKYGKSYIRITTEKTTPRILGNALVEFNRMILRTNLRRKYRYRNPFPA